MRTTSVALHRITMPPVYHLDRETLLRDLIAAERTFATLGKTMENLEERHRCRGAALMLHDLVEKIKKGEYDDTSIPPKTKARKVKP